MTVLAVEPSFTFEEWSRIVSDPTQNMAYLSTQLGEPVADYLSWKLNEDTSPNVPTPWPGAQGFPDRGHHRPPLGLRR